MSTRVEHREERKRITPMATQASTRLLQSARATFGWEERSRLAEHEEAVRHYILTHFPRLGRAPLRREIAERHGLSSEQLEAILNRLQSLDLLYLDPKNQEIQVAYPFSTVPTSHVVRFIDSDEATRRYAQCAIDALGIPFMFCRDVSIVSSCEYCTKPIAIEVGAGAIEHHHPAETVLWVGTNRTACAATSICRTLNFFCSTGHVSAWRQNRPEQIGEVLSLGEALYLSKGIFEDLLKSPQRERGPSRASSDRASRRKTIATVNSVGGVLAAFLASVCCVGPLLLAAVGVGIGATGVLAGTANVLKVLLPYRPMFIGLTVLLLGTAFYLVYRSPRGTCRSAAAYSRGSTSRISRTWLWIVTAIAAVFVFAPYWLGL